MFQPGQLVQCVDASEWVRQYGPIWRRIPLPLVLGRIYTVAGVIDRLLPSKRGLTNGVVLVEVRSVAVSGGFASWRFRPLDDDRLEVFRRIARSAPVKEDA